MKFSKILRLLVISALMIAALALFACGETPAESEKESSVETESQDVECKHEASSVNDKCESVCADCGEEGEDVVLDVMNGAVRCADCRREAEETAPSVIAEDAHATILCVLTESARAALFYVLRCPLEKILSFRLESDADMQSFSYAAETYLLNHLERTFKNLEFYKTLPTE